jgi:hypothetical protein
MQTKMELMAQAITKFIPNTPENQALLPGTIQCHILFISAGWQPL